MTRTRRSGEHRSCGAAGAGEGQGNLEETILHAIESALLTAYRHTEGAHSHARVEIDRQTGAAIVYAQEFDPRAILSVNSTTPPTTSAASPR
jgi:hypothetical protein